MYALARDTSFAAKPQLRMHQKLPPRAGPPNGGSRRRAEMAGSQRFHFPYSTPSTVPPT